MHPLRRTSQQVSETTLTAGGSLPPPRPPAPHPHPEPETALPDLVTLPTLMMEEAAARDLGISTPPMQRIGQRREIRHLMFEAFIPRGQTQEPAIG